MQRPGGINRGGVGADGAQPLPTTKLGDANVYQGSIIGNLNTLPQNTNINLTSGDDMLGLWRQTTLEHTIQYSYLEEANVTQPGGAGGDTTQTVFQFSITEWSNTQDFYLDIPVYVTYTAPAIVTEVQGKLYSLDPLLINNSSMRDALRGSVWNYLPTDPGDNISNKIGSGAPFENGWYPDNGVIQLFNSFEVYGGTNNQPLGKSFMMFAPNIANIGTNDKINNDHMSQIQGICGLPCSNVLQRPPVGLYNGIPSLVNNSGGVTYSNGGPVSHKVNRKQLDAYERVVRMPSTTFGGTLAARAGNPPVDTYTSANFVLSIPLSKISEFFKTNKFVPPEFRFKITMSTFNAGARLYSSICQGPDGITPAQVNYRVFRTDPTVGNPVIRYKSQVLQASLQNALNEKWARNVITYNIETKDTYDFRSNTSPLVETINISQQRPLQLEIVCRALNDGAIPAAPGVEGEGPPVNYGRSSIIFSKNSVVPWLSDTWTPLNIKQIQIFISGRPIISWRNDYPANSDIFCEGWQNVINSDLKRCAVSNGRQPGQFESQWTGPINSQYSGAPIIIPLTPNMFWDNNIYATDQGATQIKLAITFENTAGGNAVLNNNFAVRVYKVYTQQLSVDTNQKVTLTEWPARVLQGGSQSSLSQPPVVPGN